MTPHSVTPPSMTPHSTTPLEVAAAATGTTDRGQCEGAGGAAGSPRCAGRLRATTTGPAGTSARAAGSTRLVGLSAAVGTTRATGTTRAAGLSAAAGPAGLLRNEDERPLVVVVAPEIEADRLVLAPAAHAGHAARDRAAADRATLLRAARLTEAPRGGAAGTRRAAAGQGASAGLARLPRLTRLARRSGRAQVLELLAGDRVQVFLAQVVPLHQHVDARRQRPHLGLEEADGAEVLLAAENELRFLLALGLVPPHRQRDGHQYRHHRQRHQQRGHRVPRLTP